MSTLASTPGREPQETDWDVLIVGTGMGGATLGWALARAGWRVLFLEKGRSHLAAPQALCGKYAEGYFPRIGPAKPEQRAILERAGRTWEYLEDRSGPRTDRFVPFLGCGTGGSTALYGMALERLRRSDFETWPIGYEVLRPYYQAAERLFQVCGTPDPLRDEPASPDLPPPPPLHPANRALAAFLDQRGLHPYRLPLACDYRRGSDRCQGFLDAAGGRRDAATECLEPALHRHGARLLDRCEVLRIEANRHRVTGLSCCHHGRPLQLRGRVVVLAAGALSTPCLLLRSISPDWPTGLANRSGLVGRHLMRHFIDLYLVDPGAGDLGPGNLKELAFNDWYALPGAPGGTVQSFGCLPPASQLAAEWPDELRLGPCSPLRALLSLCRPLLSQALRGILKRNLVLAAILADPPRPHNLIRPGRTGEARMVLEYRMRPADRRQVTAFRARMRRLLAPLRVRLLKQAENNRRLAHACGTCRFGTDPDSSVLDPTNRAHDLENLYVTDASFFPTSGGTNPALTIAANALRVAEHLGGAPVRQAWAADPAREQAPAS